MPFSFNLNWMIVCYYETIFETSNFYLLVHFGLNDSFDFHRTLCTHDDIPFDNFLDFFCVIIGKKNITFSINTSTTIIVIAWHIVDLFHIAFCIIFLNGRNWRSQTDENSIQLGLQKSEQLTTIKLKSWVLEIRAQLNFMGYF